MGHFSLSVRLERRAFARAPLKSMATCTQQLFLRRPEMIKSGQNLPEPVDRHRDERAKTTSMRANGIECAERLAFLRVALHAAEEMKSQRRGR